MLHRNSHPRSVLVARVHARTYARTIRYVRTYEPDTFSRVVFGLSFLLFLPLSPFLSLSLSLSLPLSLPPVFLGDLSFLSCSRIRVTRLASRITALVLVKKHRAGVGGRRTPPRASFHPQCGLLSSRRCPFFPPLPSLTSFVSLGLSCGTRGVDSSVCCWLRGRMICWLNLALRRDRQQRRRWWRQVRECDVVLSRVTKWEFNRFSDKLRKITSTSTESHSCVCMSNEYIYIYIYTDNRYFPFCDKFVCRRANFYHVATIFPNMPVFVSLYHVFDDDIHQWRQWRSFGEEW